MVAKISVGNSLYGALAYNGEKINNSLLYTSGSISAHCALALLTANRHRQIISVILVLMLLWILVDFIIYCSPIGWSGFGFTRT